MSDEFDNDDEWDSGPADWGEEPNEDEEGMVGVGQSMASLEIIEDYYPEKAKKEFAMVKTFLEFNRSAKQSELRDMLNEIVIIQNKENLTPESEKRLESLKIELGEDSAFKETMKEFNKSISNANMNLKKEKDTLQKEISLKKSNIQSQIKNYEKEKQSKLDEIDVLKLKLRRAMRSQKSNIETDIEILTSELDTIDTRIESMRNDIMKVENDYEFKSNKSYIEKLQNDINDKIYVLEFMQSLPVIDDEISTGKENVVELMEKMEPIQKELENLERQFDLDKSNNITNFALLPSIYRKSIKLTEIDSLIKDNIEKNLNVIQKLKINKTKMENNMRDIKNMRDSLSQKIRESKYNDKNDMLNTQNKLRVYEKEYERILRDLTKINQEIEMNSRELYALYRSDKKQCPICTNYKFLESCYQCSLEMCTDCRGTQSKCPQCSSEFAEYKVNQKDKFYKKYGKYGDAIVTAIVSISPEAGNTYGADSSIGTMITEMEKFVNDMNRKYEKETGQRNKFKSLNDIINFYGNNPVDSFESGGMARASAYEEPDYDEETLSRVAEMSRRDEEERLLRQLERERQSMNTVESKGEYKFPDKTTMAGIIDDYLPNQVSLSDFARMTDEELNRLYKMANEKKLLIKRLIELQNIQDYSQINDLKNYDTEELRGILASLEDF